MNQTSTGIFLLIIRGSSIINKIYPLFLSRGFNREGHCFGNNRGAISEFRIIIHPHLRIKLNIRDFI